jgi:hypothetical protein
VLDERQRWRDDQRPQAFPKSALGQAIGYALNHGETRGRSLEPGYRAIDNNLSERTLRAIALGRNNGSVLGSETGDRTAAGFDTIGAPCKHLGIDPFASLRVALSGLFTLGEKPTAEQLTPWLPDRWLLSQLRHAPVEPHRDLPRLAALLVETQHILLAVMLEVLQPQPGPRPGPAGAKG